MEELVKELQKEAELGLAGAQLSLAICYYEGIGVEIDVTQAVYWFKKAAEQGDADAQYNLAFIEGEELTQL